MADPELLFTVLVPPYQQFEDDHTPSHLDPPPVSELRIVKFSDHEFYLESLAESGDLFGDTLHETVEQAMNDALEGWGVQLKDWNAHAPRP